MPWCPVPCSNYHVKYTKSCILSHCPHPLALPPSSRTASRPASVHTSEREDNVDSSSIATTDVDTKISITLDSKVSTSCQAVTAVVEMYTLCNNRPVRYSCCINSCVCFVGLHEDLTECPNCKESRFKANGKPRKYFDYIPVIPRLQAMSASPKWTAEYLRFYR